MDQKCSDCCWQTDAVNKKYFNSVAVPVLFMTVCVFHWQLNTIDRVILCVFNEPEFTLYEKWMQTYFPLQSASGASSGIIAVMFRILQVILTDKYVNEVKFNSVLASLLRTKTLWFPVFKWQMERRYNSSSSLPHAWWHRQNNHAFPR